MAPLLADGTVPSGFPGRPRWGAGLGLCVLLASWASSAQAQALVPEVDSSTTTKSLDPRLSAGETWPAGRVDGQLDEDSTLIPFGKGAIFVPSMTTGLDEPPVEILSGEERVAEGTSGQRIILAPGTYTVRIGSGATQQRMVVQATVRELSTTVIPVSWSGLTVHVVNERYNSLRASYELIRVSDREYMGIGFGTDEQAGEPISTWVLRPGLYKIVRVGENYRARRDFVTVRLVQGEHTHFLLVLNEVTGEFAGGGEVPESELFRTGQALAGSLVVGGDVTLNSRSNVIGFADGDSFTAQGFIDGRLSVQIFDNPLILRLQVEQGITNPPSGTIQKTIDRVDLDALYVYSFEPWIGPYIRFGAETSIFPAEAIFSEDVTIVKLADGVETERTTGRTVQISPFLGFTTISEGVGLNVRAFKSVSAELNVRAGVGARHRIAQDILQLDGCSRPDGAPPTALDECRFEQILGNDQFGVETVILATVRLTRFILVNLELDALLTPVVEDSIVELESSVALKLTSFLSINYVARYRRDPTINVNLDSFEQDILLRFSVDLL